MRRWVRHALDLVATGTGAMRVLERRATSGVTVLTYHRVLPDDRWQDAVLPKLAVTETCFREQARWLAECATVLPAGECLAALERGPPPRPLFAMTFDDGYADNAEVAAPILSALGLRATFYVTTGFVEGGSTWFDRAALHWRRSPTACAAAAHAEGAVAVPPPHATDPAAWMRALKASPHAVRTAVLARLDAEAPLGAALIPTGR